MSTLLELPREIIVCRRCPHLVTMFDEVFINVRKFLDGEREEPWRRAGHYPEAVI